MLMIASLLDHQWKILIRYVDSMNNGDKNFVLTDEGDINKLLGIEITQLDDKRFKYLSHIWQTE